MVRQNSGENISFDIVNRENHHRRIKTEADSEPYHENEPFSITQVVCVGQKLLQVWDFTQKYSNVNATLVHELKIYPHKPRKVECKKQEKS